MLFFYYLSLERLSFLRKENSASRQINPVLNIGGDYAIVLHHAISILQKMFIFLKEENDSAILECSELLSNKFFDCNI